MTKLLRPSLLALAVLLAPLPAAASGQVVSADYVSILENRLAALEQQVQTLTNQAEQAGYQARVTQERLQRLEEDLNTRFRMIESQQQSSSQEQAPQMQQNSGTGAVQRLGTVSNSGNAAAAQAPVLPADANVAYDQAFAKIRDGNYEEAEVAMRAFLQRWPSIDLSSNAAYWLGETLYVRGDFGGAAKAFAEAYQKYPKGAKAEDTLLKLGLALGALNRKQDACIAFDQLSSEFPRMSANTRRRIEQERSQLSCQANASQSSSSASTQRRSQR